MKYKFRLALAVALIYPAYLLAASLRNAGELLVAAGDWLDYHPVSYKVTGKLTKWVQAARK